MLLSNYNTSQFTDNTGTVYLTDLGHVLVKRPIQFHEDTRPIIHVATSS